MASLDLNASTIYACLPTALISQGITGSVRPPELTLREALIYACIPTILARSDTFSQMIRDRTNYRVLSEKYCNLRFRFVSKFLYSGLCADSLSPRGANAQVKFSDQQVSMGLALLAFAAESQVLRDAGLNTESSEAIIRQLLAAFETLKRPACEALGYVQYEDGFFVRDWVAAERTSDLGVPENLSIKSDFDDTRQPGGDRKWNSASLDQVIHMMVGWWAVCMWSTDVANRVSANRQASSVLGWLKRHRYRLYQPDGELVPRGENAWFAGAGIKRICEMMDANPTGNLPRLPDGSAPVVTIPSEDIPLFENIEANEYWKALRDLFVAELEAMFMILGIHIPGETPNITDEWLNRIVVDLINNRAPVLTTRASYERNLSLLLTAFDPAVDTDAYNDYAEKSNHWLAIVLRRACLSKRGWWRRWVPPPEPGEIAIDLSDRSAEAKAFYDLENSEWLGGEKWVARFRKTYESCPDEGPFASLDGEWVKPNRWLSATDLQATDEARTSQQEYNGLDFLSFEPLLRITGVASVFA